MPRTLAIDTSGPACSVALFDGEALVAERHELIGRGHAEILIPWIAALPDGGRADAIIVGCGPGSFTGVRVGVAAARGLGLAWGVPVYGCSSLALIAQDAGGDLVLVATEGGHGELFVQSFEGSPLVPNSTLQSLAPEAAAAQFAGDRVAGSGAARLIAARGYGVAIAAEPKASLTLQLALDLRRLPPLPIYGRAPDARPLAA